MAATLEALDQSCASAMNFTENQQGIAILGKLRLQKNMGRFCDVAFHVGSHTYRAHRNVLAACSPYFDSILSQSGKEDVIVNCNNPQVFGTLLDYIYSGKVVIHLNTVSELLILANQYMMSKLKNYCCEYLERNIRIDNCYSIRDLAGKCGLPAMCKSAEAFVLANIIDVWQQKEVLGFSRDELEMTLANKSLPVTEQHKLDLICRWIAHDAAQRERHFSSLCGLLQWSMLSVTAVYSLLQDNLLFRKSERCVLQLLEALEMNGQLFDSYRETLNNLRNKLASELQQVSYNALLHSNPDPSLYMDKLPQVPQQYSEQQHHIPPADEYDSDNDPGPDCYSGDGMVTNNMVPNNMPPCQYTPMQYPPVDPYCPQSVMQDKSGNKRKRSRPLKIGAESEDTTSSAKQVKHNIPKRRRRKEEEGNVGKENGSLDNETSDSIPCNHCTFSASSEDKLEHHISRVHKDNIKLVCNICEWSTKWSRDYNTHMKEHFQGPPYLCDTEGCAYSTERLQLLLYHRRKHSNDRPYQCPICNQRFRSRNNLTAHVRCHTGLKPFVCPICSRAFATKGTLDQHSVTHSDARPYLCDTCGFSTKYQSHLISHRRIHTGDVFKCQHPKCKYVTPKRSQLACHMRSHMAIRSHTCSTCGKGFVEKSHLVRHERIHTNERPHKCEQCGYSSSRRDKLKEHINKHHKPSESDNASSASSSPRKKPRKRKTKVVTNMDDCGDKDDDTDDAEKAEESSNRSSPRSNINKCDSITSGLESNIEERVHAVGLHLPHVPQEQAPPLSSQAPPNSSHEPHHSSQTSSLSTHPLPHPSQSLTISSQPLSHPAQPLPHLSQASSVMSQALSHPSQAPPTLTRAPLHPTQAPPHPTRASPHLTRAPPLSTQALAHPSPAQPHPSQVSTSSTSENPSVLKMLGSVISQDTYDKAVSSDSSQDPVVSTQQQNSDPDSFMFNTPTHSSAPPIESMQTPPAMLQTGGTDTGYSSVASANHPSTSQVQPESQDLSNLQSIMNAYPSLFPN